MDALEEAVEECQDLVWALTRRGFLTRDQDLLSWVLGIEDRDVAEDVAVHLLAEVIGPAERQQIDSAEALKSAALAHAKKVLWNRAVRAGRVTTLQGDSQHAQVPAAVEDIDRLISARCLPSLDAVPQDAGATEWLKRAQGVCAEVEAASDDRTKTLLQLRFREGQTCAQVAAHFTCGAAAVTAHEIRLRRQLGRALQRALPDHPRGPSTIDAIFSQDAFSAVPANITRARIRRDVLRRTFQDEPKSFAARAVWGVAAGLVAATAWGLMFVGILPGYDDDTYPTPAAEVQCEGGCGPGKTAQIKVLAPKDASRVAISLKTESGSVPLLVSPSGGSIRLPFGSGTKMVPIAYPAQWPKDVPKSAQVVAVFSGSPLAAEQITALVEGHLSQAGVLLATATIK